MSDRPKKQLTSLQIETLKKYQFKSGQSGNPGGRPKKSTLQRAIDQLRAEFGKAGIALNIEEAVNAPEEKACRPMPPEAIASSEAASGIRRCRHCNSEKRVGAKGRWHCGTCQSRRWREKMEKQKRAPPPYPGPCPTCFTPRTLSGDSNRWRCLECARKGAKRWMDENPEKHRTKCTNYNRRRESGFTPDEYAVALEKQGGVCSICGGTNGNRQLAADHCHKTGKKRGLLCNNCNLGLGHFKDSLQRLEFAKCYLLRHQNAANSDTESEQPQDRQPSS